MRPVSPSQHHKKLEVASEDSIAMGSLGQESPLVQEPQYGSYESRGYLGVSTSQRSHQRNQPNPLGQTGKKPYMSKLFQDSIHETDEVNEEDRNSCL